MKNKELIVGNGKLTMEGWEEEIIKNCLDKSKFTIGKIKSSEVNESGTYPVVDQSQNFLAGYSEKQELLYDGKLPVVVYGDRTNIVKHINFRFIQGADGIKILIPNKKVNSRYFFYALNWFKPESKGYRRHYSILKKIKIPYPKSLSEQRRIVSKLDGLFAEIDASLALIDQNIEQAEALKLSVLDAEINEQNFDKVPYLKYIKERKEKLKPEAEITYNIIGLENIESYSGKLIGFKPLKGKESRSNKSVFKKGDVLYSKLRPYLNKVLIANFDGIATTEIMPFIVDSDKFINTFVSYFLRSESIVQLINLSCSGARMPRTKKSFWKTLEIPTPSIKTQQKIVQKLDTLFEEIDGLVSDYQQKREDLEALKSSLLDRAFKGEL